VNQGGQNSGWFFIPAFASQSEENGKGGYLYLALIGLLLSLAGGTFVYWLGWGYLRARETLNWPTYPAKVIQSTIAEHQIGPKVPVEFSHDLIYRYQVDGQTYYGDRVKRRENPHFKERAKVEAWIREWPEGSEVAAIVNPDDPGEALLEHETRAPGYSIWFPGLFLVGGLVIFGRALAGLVRRKPE
jgi:hypothetical protein